MEGMALTRYATPDDAANAKKALNMFMAGSTMLVATIATDQEVIILIFKIIYSPILFRFEIARSETVKVFFFFFAMQTSSISYSICFYFT